MMSFHREPVPPLARMHSMIRSIRIKNFKSYASAELPLASLTFLIGANASGKSNALEAIRLLSWLAKGQRLDDIARSIQGANTLVRGQPSDLFHGTSNSFQIGCDFGQMADGWRHLSVNISLLSDQLIVSGEAVTKPTEYLPLYKVDGEANPVTDEIRVMYNNFKKGGNKPHIPCSNRQAVFFQLESPGRFSASNTKSRRVITTVTKQIRETLRNVIFLDPRPSRMRDYSYVKSNDIEEDGQNLSSVLFGICNRGKEAKEQLLEFIRSFPEQDITDVRFIETERQDVMVKLVESFGGVEREVDAPLLSDGTLRVLAVAATLLSAPRGAFVVIEEIDNGVHPSRADGLVRQLQKVSTERDLRVLVTTHNPALLDSLPDDALADVLCCYRDPAAGASRIARLGELDRYPELVAQGSLGELVTHRVLDRFLKDSTTADERKRKSQEWLANLKSEVAK
jgi:predicted ATPase